VISDSKIFNRDKGNEWEERKPQEQEKKKGPLEIKDQSAWLSDNTTG